MADCPNCGTEVRPEWSLCPHCKVNMRTYEGPRGGYVHPATPVTVAPSQAPAPPPASEPAQPAPEAPEAPVPAAPAPSGAATSAACPHCGAALPSPDTEYCPQCGDPVSDTSAVARMRRMLANRYLVAALGVVFVLLLAGIVLGGPAQELPDDTIATVPDVGALPSPTATAAAIRSASPTATVEGRSTVPRAATSGNVTPRANATVVVIKTLDRYIQNAGGDPGSQLRTPTVPETPVPPSPVPTSASGSAGALAWSGEGTYVTEPFALGPGMIQVEMTAGVLTMVQLRDTAGTAIGIATAGPQPATTPIRVPVAGTYRLEVWPFGSGQWSIRVSTVPITTAPTLVPVTTAAPVVIVTTGIPTTAETTVPTTIETVTQVTTQVPTAVPTTTQTQPRRSWTSESNGTFPIENIELNKGDATFGYSTTATGTFSVTLLDPSGTVVGSIFEGAGPIDGSTRITIPVTSTDYHLDITASGAWKVEIV